MALITLLDAQLAFGHVPLLDHADFSLETAERVGLIGRNGAGKSSMLKILGGMDRPDDGTVQVASRVRHPRAPRLRRVLPAPPTSGSSSSRASMPSTSRSRPSRSGAASICA